MALSVSIFLISLSLLSYEILLMRIFSIISWSHFAYMVISLALLGFGASGTFLTFFREKINKKFEFLFILFSLLYGIALFTCVWIIQLIPFSPFLIVWYKIQSLYLFLYYLILSVPFFLGASCIGMSFIRFDRKIPELYLFNMLGSGAGALTAVLLMYIFFPTSILFLLTTLGFSAAVIFTSRMGKKYLLRVFLLCLVITSLFYFHPLHLEVSEYKGLSKSLNLPASRVLKKYTSPLGLIHVL
ncbi:MAG: SAM-dependent methyltransferase, partial [Candidatus Aerophobetes bacterium]|nr:SAM-dependent methyltransferase [Candidatus Aerophobetes bacterium]